MASPYAAGIHLVQVTTDEGELQLWIAATPLEEAVNRVLDAVPEGWSAALLTDGLTQEQADTLQLRPGEVRKVTSQAN